MSVTVTDLFCGAGGSSSGALAVPGVVVRMAANHWRLAVETHNTNHPGTDHDCADLSQVDPRRYPRTDVLWASPSCTNHSQAKGKKRAGGQGDLFEQPLSDEAAERSRATMWDVVRFAEHHRYAGIVVENVVDAAKWVLWPAWRAALDSLGYCVHVVYLNSMHAQALGAPAPQSRDRLYVVAHTGSRCPDLDRWTRPAAWCPTCDQTVTAVQAWKHPTARWGRYRAQYVYRCPSATCRNAVVEPGFLPAAGAIDWALPGERIGDKALKEFFADKAKTLSLGFHPLAPKTLARIAAGLTKYARPATSTAGSVPGATPVLVPVEGRTGKTAAPVVDPLRTQTARNETALVQVAPFLAELRGGGSTHRPVSEPAATFTASGTHHGLVVPPLVMRNNTARGNPAQMLTPVDEALRTLTTTGHQSLVVPTGAGVVEASAVYGYDTGHLRSPLHALPTQTTVQGDALVTAGALPAVEDCLFRMLEPHEIQLGMAFHADYRVLGNKREQVRQLGNAVTPPAARDLLAALVEAITGEQIDYPARDGALDEPSGVTARLVAA